jgi:hypothetical protein
MENNESKDVTRRRALQVIGVGVLVPAGALMGCTQESGTKEAKSGHSDSDPEKSAASKPKEDEKKKPEAAADGEKTSGGEMAKSGEAKGGEAKGEGGEVVCDTSGIDAQSKQMRKTLQYVSKSPKEGKQCNNCMQWIKPKAGEKCGGCKLFSGPVNPNGYCLSYAPMKKA